MYNNYQYKFKKLFIKVSWDTSSEIKFHNTVNGIHKSEVDLEKVKFSLLSNGDVVLTYDTLPDEQFIRSICDFVSHSLKI